MNNPFNFASIFNKVDKLLGVDCKVWICATLVTQEKIVAFSIWKFVHQLPKSILKVKKYCLHNVFYPR